MYKSEFHNAKETKQILEKRSPNDLFKVYHKFRKRRRHHMKKDTLTLSQLAEKIDNLGNDLRNEMNAGFKKVNERIDKIDARLDYIVDTNNLKDYK